MKKYGFCLFLLVFWCVAALFSAPAELVPVAAFAAAWACLAFIPRRGASYLAAAAVCAAASVFDLRFLWRICPAVLLCAAHGMAVRFCGDANAKQKSASPDRVYTALLVSVLLSAGVTVADAAAYLRAPAAAEPQRFYWVFAGIAAYYASLILCFRICARARGREKGAPRFRKPGVLTAYYAVGLFCCVCAAAGFFLRSAALPVHFAAFPWLCLAALTSASGDPAGAELARALPALLRRVVS